MWVTSRCAQVNLLSEPFGGPRVRAGGGSDAGDSGTSTPRSMPGMSIEEFEIIKPISRGAFGRVYLARKLATGDLFAIKVEDSACMGLLGRMGSAVGAQLGPLTVDGLVR